LVLLRPVNWKLYYIESIYGIQKEGKCFAIPIDCPETRHKWRVFTLLNFYTGGAISPKETYAISRFLAKILPVPISPIFFEIYISNYLLSVMNDVIFRIDFLKSSLFNFYLIAFGGVFTSMHFGDLLHTNLLQNSL
jgi:hypothetical protein